MSWEETKRQSQSVFQGLRGDAVAFGWDRPRDVLFLEQVEEEAWQEHLARDTGLAEPEREHGKSAAFRDHVMSVFASCKDVLTDIGRDYGRYGDHYPLLIADIERVLDVVELENAMRERDESGDDPLARYRHEPLLERSMRTHEPDWTREPLAGHPALGLGVELENPEDLKSRMIGILTACEDIFTDMGREYGDNYPLLIADVERLIDVFAPERAQALEEAIRKYQEQDVDKEYDTEPER